MSGPTVSKAVQRLEARLGEKLIHRTSRRFALTEAGRVLAVRAARILAEGEAAEAEAHASSAVPHGRVRLAAPMSFGLRHIAPALPEFLAAYPEVSVDLQLDDRLVDLIAGGIDVAIRIAELEEFQPDRAPAMPGASLGGRRAGLFRAARPAGSAARPAAPRVPWLSYLASGETWRFTDPDGAEEAVAVKGPLSATNADALGFALEAGCGMALQPDFLVWEAVRDRRVEIALDGWSAPSGAVHLITPAGGPRPPRVAVLLDFLARRFSAGAAPWAADLRSSRP